MIRSNIILFFSIITIACSSKNPTNKADSVDFWSVKMADAVINRNDSLVHFNKKIKWQYDVAMLGQAIDKLGFIDSKYSTYNEAYLSYFINDDGSIKKYKKTDYNLDNINPAKGLITLYKRNGNNKYYLAIQSFVGQLEEQPRTISGGFWHKKIYPWQMWLDGIYMASPFMAQYAREFNEERWLDTAANQVLLIYSKTHDANTGLLYHAWDESKKQEWCNPETGQSKEFWGRAMGWYLMALVDILEYMPTGHWAKDSINSIFKNTIDALLKVRDKETGLWYQVLDKKGMPGNYLESSCSCMFTYAMAKGVKKGILPLGYYDIANKTFDKIIENFIVQEEDGFPSLIKTCGSAGLGGDPYRDGTYFYYVNEKIVTNDPKGLGPFIYAAIELNR